MKMHISVRIISLKYTCFDFIANLLVIFETHLAISRDNQVSIASLINVSAISCYTHNAKKALESCSHRIRGRMQCVLWMCDQVALNENKYLYICNRLQDTYGITHVS